MLTNETILESLKGVKYPGFSRDIVSFGLVRQIECKNGTVSVSIQLTSANPEAARQIQSECERTLRGLPGVQQVTVDVAQPAAQPGGGAPPTAWSNQARVPGVRHILAVASGKGGVGKSTCAVNLACALQRLGARVGLLDCDIYGPTIPLMMGIHERPTVSEAEKLVPPANYGVKLMSIGFLVEGDQPVIWRGPMIMKTIQQFLHAVEWGELDYLLVDLPPGTGDAQLSLCQTVPLDGGLIVTTPQEASVSIVRKGILMFDKVNVPILGLIENMSGFTTPAGEHINIFGKGGGREEARRQNIPFLGEVPIYTAIREGGDLGRPVVCASPESPEARVFLHIAELIKNRLP